MPCMCGDFCCPSCGPAQGNFRCPSCRKWASDGCECTTEQIALAEQAERDADEAYEKDLAKAAIDGAAEDEKDWWENV